MTRNRPVPRSRRLVLPVCVVLLLAGACADSPEDPVSGATSPVADAVPQPVSLPEISGLDADVQRQVRDAHAGLLTAIEDGTVSGDRYGRLGMLFSSYGLANAAEVTYLNARILAPGDFQWPYYLSLLYEETSKIDQAIDSLERALELLASLLLAILALEEDQGVRELLAHERADGRVIDKPDLSLE